MNELKKALLANAIFSILSGIIFLLFSKEIADLFDLQVNSIFKYIGLTLVFFSATIAYENYKLRRPFVLWIIVQDLLWVLGSIILVIFKPFAISTSGYFIIIGIAIIVLYMAIIQYKTLNLYFLKN